MSQVIRKAMILSAGLGTRLHPITQTLPKPLIPVLNVPNILHAIHLLKRAGITELIINLHHLPHAIESYLRDGRTWGVQIEYSREQQLLGTGGGVKKAEPFFKGDPFVLVNCDFVSDVDLIPHIIRHLQRKALATMLLLEDPKRQPQYAPVGVDENDRLCSLPRFEKKAPIRKGIFTGIHILDGSVLNYLTATPSGINEILYPALMKELPDRVFGDRIAEGIHWFDTGEMEPLRTSSMALLPAIIGPSTLSRFLQDFGQMEQASAGVWVSKGTKIPANVRCQAPVIIGNQCRFLGEKIEIGPSTVLGDGTSVAGGVSIARSISIGEGTITTGNYKDCVFFKGQPLS